MFYILKKAGGGSWRGGGRGDHIHVCIEDIMAVTYHAGSWVSRVCFAATPWQGGELVDDAHCNNLCA